MTKGVDERIHECILQRFGHVERMVNERYAKRVYVGECAGSRSVGRSQKRWTDREGLFKEKRFGCQVTKDNGAE